MALLKDEGEVFESALETSCAQRLNAHKTRRHMHNGRSSPGPRCS